MKRYLALAALLVVACKCTAQPAPAPVQPPLIVGDAGSDPCGQECATLHALGCSSWSATCVGDCKRLAANLAKESQPAPNYTCVIRATSCAAAMECP